MFCKCIVGNGVVLKWTSLALCGLDFEVCQQDRSSPGYGRSEMRGDVSTSLPGEEGRCLNSDGDKRVK